MASDTDHSGEGSSCTREVDAEQGQRACRLPGLRCLPTETVHEVAYWFDKLLKGECRAPDAWKILRFVFLKKPDAKLEKGIRGFRAIALFSVFSKWYTTVLVDLPHEEKEPIECGSRERCPL